MSNNTPKITFLGPLGTYSYRASSEIFKNGFTEVPSSPFEEVFETLENDKADYAVIPIENNTAGIVDAALDLLIRSSLKIRGEYSLQIRHSLLSVENDISKINKIYSLAQPYFQCQIFIQQNLPKVEWIQVSSSAHALEMCKANPEGSSAIGYADTGIDMGLKIVSEDIQDLSDNETRFIVLSKNEDELRTSLSRSENIKTSLVFTLSDEPGKLLEILNIFRNYSLNLCHIESRPTRLKEWRYYFFLTVECDKNQNMIKQALSEIKSITPWFNDLGSYSLLS